MGGPYVKWFPRGGRGRRGVGGKYIINSIDRKNGRIGMPFGYIVPSLFANI